MVSTVNPSLRSHAIRGIVSVGIASVLIRSGGLISQLIAGRILTSTEFGLFAAALGVSTLSITGSSSLRPLLMERIAAGEDIDGLWRGCFWIVTALSASLMIAAGSISGWMNEPDAAPVIRMTVAAAPLQFLAVHGMARVGAALQFTEISRIVTRSAFLRYVAVIGLALAGFGVYSLVIPLFVEAVVQVVLTTKLQGPPPSIFGGWFEGLRLYRSQLLWVAVASVTLALSMTGDYAVLSLLETTASVGIYFFAFQLTAAITQPFTMAASSVLVPSFANASTTESVGNSFFDAIRLQLAATGFAFGGLALVGGTAMDLIWGGRWNAGSVVLIAIAVGTPFRMLNPLVNSLFQARSDFRAAGLLTGFNAGSLVAAVLIGAAIGGIDAVAVCVSISFLVLGIVVVAIAGRAIGRSSGEAFQAMVVGSIPTALGLVAAFGIFPGSIAPVGESLMRALIFVAVSGVLLYVLLRERVLEVVGALKPTVGSA